MLRRRWFLDMVVASLFAAALACNSVASELTAVAGSGSSSGVGGSVSTGRDRPGFFADGGSSSPSAEEPVVACSSTTPRPPRDAGRDDAPDADASDDAGVVVEDASADPCRVAPPPFCRTPTMIVTYTPGS